MIAANAASMSHAAFASFYKGRVSGRAYAICRAKGDPAVVAAAKSMKLADFAAFLNARIDLGTQLICASL
jgi:hypothetical protein